MSAPAQTYCAYHHRPVEQCPPPDPELGDLLPDLVKRGVDIRLTPAGKHTARCEDCTQDGVAVVARHVPSEALPEGYVCRTSYCAVHLTGAVTWQLRCGSRTWLEVPAVAAPIADRDHAVVATTRAASTEEA